MPDIHLFSTSKIPFFFTLSFLISSYCKNKNKQRWGFVVHISRSIQKNAEVFLYTIYSDSSEYKVKKEKYEILDLL